MYGTQESCTQNGKYIKLENESFVDFGRMVAPTPLSTSLGPGSNLWYYLIDESE